MGCAAVFTFWIFSLKLNIVFAGLFTLVCVGSFMLSGAYWNLSQGDFAAAEMLQTAAGGVLFGTSWLGWYMTFVIMAGEMHLGINLPMGDLSRFWPKTDVELSVAWV